MNNQYYTNEKAQQILIALLKAHQIRKIVTSPGTTNMTFVISLQHDSYFEMYSSIDERSAAYLACGLAAESGEPVVITCTEATASRNYMPGLTEAYYRKLPILAITGSHGENFISQLVPQVIDRRAVPNDIANLSIRIPVVKDKNDEWSANLKINQAILELKHHGGGPVHIDISTDESSDFSVETLPKVQIINRYGYGDKLPEMPDGKIGVFIGSHLRFTDELTRAIDNFCASHNAVVLCDQTSNYFGKYRVNYSIVASQMKYISSNRQLDCLIHIGEVSGDYWHVSSKNTWRVNEDGVIRDMFRGSLTSVFEMSELTFFKYYTKEKPQRDLTLWESYNNECQLAHKNMPELPFSNAWIASVLHDKMPEDSILHFGILNSLRAWNFFDVPQVYMASSNVGGFGIDGAMSTVVGASLANPDKLHFLFLGDLAFFYDMNALGNRYIKNNLRILVVDNGKGAEFRMTWHPAAQFGDETDKFVAAGGHFGNKSPKVIKSYVESLGFEYMTASSKEEFLKLYPHFIDKNTNERPIVFEVFTDDESEKESIDLIRNTMQDAKYYNRLVKHKTKNAIMNTAKAIKSIIH